MTYHRKAVTRTVDERQEEAKFYTQQHAHYCGVDLHSKMMYLCIMSHDGQIVLHRNLKTDVHAFLAAIAPYREGLVVGVECMFCWYWLADFCAHEHIAFVLGHALYMKAIHGGKAKNDKVDSHKIAGLLRGGMFPQAYVYPSEMRATRDLLRRRSNCGHMERARPADATRCQPLSLQLASHIGLRHMPRAPSVGVDACRLPQPAALPVTVLRDCPLTELDD
jgi:hypothetical protein